MGKAVVLLSGGLDSAVALGMVANEYEVARCLFFDYGQKAVQQEYKAAKGFCTHYKVPLEKITFDWLKTISSSALQDEQAQIPQFDTSKFSDLEYQHKTAMAVWVPNRNGLFINVAAAYADALGCKVIATGVNPEEGATFKDNTPEFITAVTNSLAWSTQIEPVVLHPLKGLDKTGIVEAGKNLKTPFGHVYSCYTGDELMCGKCESCSRSIRAYKNANMWQDIAHRFSACS